MAFQSQFAKVSASRYAVPKDPTRASLDNQIASLNAAIRKNLKRTATLTQKGQWEKASVAASMVANHRATMLNLVAKRNALLEEPARPEPDPKIKPSRSTPPKAKTYKRWSDK